MFFLVNSGWISFFIFFCRCSIVPLHRSIFTSLSCLTPHFNYGELIMFPICCSCDLPHVWTVWSTIFFSWNLYFPMGFPMVFLWFSHKPTIFAPVNPASGPRTGQGFCRSMELDDEAKRAVLEAPQEVQRRIMAEVPRWGMSGRDGKIGV